MRKFKHKPSGRTLEVKPLGINEVEGLKYGDWQIPLWILEDSCDWEEVTEVLLTTEDGVDIFEGDTFFIVGTKEGRFVCPYQVQEYRAVKNMVSNFDNQFSTREAAEEYIINNKPCLSFVEVSHALGGLSYFQAKNLLDIVKEKL